MPCPTTDEEWDKAAGFLKMLDADKSMSVSLDEAVGFWAQHCGPEGGRPGGPRGPPPPPGCPTLGEVESIFKMLDTSEDKTIHPEEAKEAVKKMCESGNTPDGMPCDWNDAKGFLEMLDTNGDMKVTWNETEAFWFEHCGDPAPPRPPKERKPRGPTFYADKAY